MSIELICVRLPLVPRRPLSAFETTDNKKRSNQAAKKRADDAGDPSPPPPEDMDERLVFDAHRLANQYVHEMVRSFQWNPRKIQSYFHLQLTTEQASIEVEPVSAAPAAPAAAAGGKDAKGAGKDAKDAKGGKGSAGKGGKKGAKKEEAPVEGKLVLTFLESKLIQRFPV